MVSITLCLSLLAACSTVSSPPSVSNYRTEIHKENGETSVSGSYQNSNGGILEERRYSGGTVQLNHQLTKNLQVGGNVDARFSHHGKETENEGLQNEYRVNTPTYALSGKGLVRYDLPQVSWIDIGAGLGVGYTETDQIAGTADAGITIGPEKTLTSLDIFKPYVGYVGGISVPLKRGEPLVREVNYQLNDDQYASTTLYHGGIGGLGIKLADNSLLFTDVKLGEGRPFGAEAPDAQSARDYKDSELVSEVQVGLEYSF